MKQFEITYSDGKIVSGTNARAWRKAADTGVQIIIILHNDDSAQEIMRGFDWYTLQSNDDIVGTDGAPASGRAKEGELISTEEHTQLCEYAINSSSIWNR